MGATKPFFKLVDCVMVQVPSVEEGVAFYHDKLGHSLIWRTPTSAGLRLPGAETELVVYIEKRGVEVDMLVDSVDTAAERWRESGGAVVVEPFDIPIGRCAVLRDPWGNQLVILDQSKGLFVTDSDGNVTGIGKKN
jgi:predicted enzyme related to lactoylglutathione lyase